MAESQSPPRSELSAVKRQLMERLLRGDAAASPSTTIPRRPEGTAAPLSFSQQRLWFLDQMMPGNPFYNVPMALPLPAATSPRVIERCLAEIMRRHESLRTRFEAVDGRPVQVVVPDATVEMPVVPLRNGGADERRAAAREIAEQEARMPFDLARGPLLRAKLLDLGVQGQLLLLTLHHIVSDGWSMGILFREMSQLYPAFASGRRSPLAELPIQYADFAIWQRERVRGDLLERQLAFWKEQLRDLPSLQLPTDRPRPPLPSHRGARHWTHLPRRLSDALRARAAAEGASLFMAMLSAFYALLHRQTGQDDIVVGVPTAGRNVPEVESLIGFFVNSLVLRAQVDAHEPWHRLLDRVKQMTLRAYANQDVPFETLVETLHPERDLSRNPLFQVTFQLANTPVSGELYRSGETPDYTAELGTAIFDLAVNLWDTPDGIRGQWEYSTDLFDAASIERIAAQYERLLEGVARDPALPIGSLPLLDAAGWRRVLLEFNQTAAPRGAPACVQAQFEARAVARPDAAALIDGDTAWTYAALNRRANRLAHRLIAAGVGTDQRVALYLERSAAMVVAMLATLKAGAAYVPVAPDYPADRVRHMLHDAAPAIVLTRQRHVDALAQPVGAAAPLWCLDGPDDVSGPWPEHDPGRPVRPRDLAYVIYTSGSTGRPKGVMIEHGALANHMEWMGRQFPLTPSDRVLQRTAFSFDASVWEVYAPLLAGATLVLAPPGVDRDPGLVIDTIMRHGIGTLQLVPSLAQQVLDEPGFGRCSTLRRLFFGGESLAADLAARALQLPDVEIVNLYGPTEATIDATWHGVDRAAAGTAVPIGRAIANMRAYVVDAQGQPVPVGVPGELWLAGDGLARGYLNQPEATAQRFVEFRVEGRGVERVYKTGDLVRWRDDGILECLGRIDGQIKLRGVRIEPGEIEAVLREHESVADAVVVSRDDHGHRRLVAYLATNDPPSSAELRAHLKARLPEFMVPAVFVSMQALPLTPNGKIDRKALPAPDGVRPELEQAFVAPASDAERTLARIWSEVLGVQRVGSHDNFFELGGDSILSIQIVSRAKQAGLQLTPQQIFQHQSVAELAAAANAGAGTEILSEQGRVAGPVPLTPIQHWFVDQQRDEMHHFNQASLLMLPREIRPEPMRAAVAGLVDHHDALRLRLAREGTGWTLFNAPVQDPVPFEHVDSSTLDGAAASRCIEDVAQRLQRSLDLAEGPIVRVALITLAASARLVIVIHHLAVDALSWRVLIEDLLTLYGQHARGQGAALPDKTSSFRQWAERCVALAGEPSFAARELEHWLGLADVDASLPIDVVGQDNSVGAACQVDVALDEEATRIVLRELPAALRVQVHELLLAALGITLASWTGRAEHLIDLESHGREPLFADLDLSRSVGWFTSIAPLRLPIGRDDAPARAIESAKQALRAVPNHGIGFGLLRQLCPQESVRERLRLLAAPQIAFNYLGRVDESGASSGPGALAAESTGAWYSPNGQRCWLIEVNAAVERGCLAVHWTYGSALHRRKTVQALADGFVAALRAFVELGGRAGVAGRTATDFSGAGLTQAELDRLLETVGRSAGPTRGGTSGDRSDHRS